MIRVVLFASVWMLTVCLPSTAHAQAHVLDGFIEDFHRASLDTMWNGKPHTLWRTDYAETYGLNALPGILEIEYTRTVPTGPDEFCTAV